MNRKDFYEEIADYTGWYEDSEFYNWFTRYYGCEPVDIHVEGYDFDRDVKWTPNLEEAYQEALAELIEQYEDEDDYESNMPCDFSGYCSGTNCPNFYKCQG
jgi:hypothetical protein